MKFIQQSTACASTKDLSEIPISQKKEKVSQKSDSKKSTKKRLKISRWTPEQNVLYLRFLKQNLQKFTQKCPKKFLKFERMSFEIQSKTPDQCRSHHQKMMMRFKSVENIILGRIQEVYTEEQVRSVKSNQTQFKEKLDVEEVSNIENLNNEIIQKEDNMEVSELEDINPFSDQNIFDVLLEAEMLGKKE